MPFVDYYQINKLTNTPEREARATQCETVENKVEQKHQFF